MSRATLRQLGDLGPPWHQAAASRRRRGSVALRPRLSPGLPLYPGRATSLYESCSDCQGNLTGAAGPRLPVVRPHRAEGGELIHSTPHAFYAAVRDARQVVTAAIKQEGGRPLGSAPAARVIGNARPRRFSRPPARPNSKQRAGAFRASRSNENRGARGREQSMFAGARRSTWEYRVRKIQEQEDGLESTAHHKCHAPPLPRPREIPGAGPASRTPLSRRQARSHRAFVTRSPAGRSRPRPSRGSGPPRGARSAGSRRSGPRCGRSSPPAGPDI